MVAFAHLICHGVSMILCVGTRGLSFGQSVLTMLGYGLSPQLVVLRIFDTYCGLWALRVMSPPAQVSYLRDVRAITLLSTKALSKR